MSWYGHGIFWAFRSQKIFPGIPLVPRAIPHRPRNAKLKSCKTSEKAGEVLCASP
jgi:hypothetical protein